MVGRIVLTLDRIPDDLYVPAIAIGWSVLPVAGSIDDRYVRRHATWGPRVFVWALLFALALLNIPAASAYLWRRWHAAPVGVTLENARPTPSRIGLHEWVSDAHLASVALLKDAPSMLNWTLGIVLLIGVNVGIATMTHLTVRLVVILLVILLIADAILRAQLAERGRPRRSGLRAGRGSGSVPMSTVVANAPTADRHSKTVQDARGSPVARTDRQLVDAVPRHGLADPATRFQLHRPRIGSPPVEPSIS